MAASVRGKQELVAGPYGRLLPGPDYHMDVELHPVSGDLTSDGIQWDTAFTTSAVGALEEAWEWKYDPFEHIGSSVYAELLLLEVALSFRLSGSQDGMDGTWKFQYSLDGETWTDLHTLETETGTINTAATSYLEKTMQGYASVSSINRTPVYFRLLVSAETAGQTVTAEVKNSSYVRGVGEVHR